MKIHLLAAAVLGFSFTALRAADIAHPWRQEVAEKQGTQTFALPAGTLGDGKQFSVEVRLRPRALSQAGTILKVPASNGQPAIELGVQDGGRYGKLIAFLITTDFRPKPLTVGFPVGLLSPDIAHDLLLRDLGFRLDLFVDGVLADQEWPIGSIDAVGLHQVETTSAARDVQIWASALPDKAVEERNGGGQAIAKRDLRLLGPQSGAMEYFRPRGYNTSAGDAMPFFHDGVLHVFYLLDRRHHQSKWGLGAHQWAHLSTTDLEHWKSYPMALTVEHEWEASICTGSVFFAGGKYYAFYATRMQDRSEHLGMAISDDGVRFRKLQPSLFQEPAPPYRRGPNRDPFVFGKRGDFHMTVTASLVSPESPDRAGALEHLTSPDLKTWTVQPAPFLVTGYAADPECSDLFFWRGWYYLLFSEGGQAHYRMSRNSTGPWSKPTVDVFDGVEARVMKTAAFKGDRRIGVAFVPDGDFGGHLLFREVVQSPDGTLHTTFVEEMIPHEKGPSTPAASTENGVGRGVKEPIELNATGSTAQASVHVSGDFILKATLSTSAGADVFGFGFNGGSEDSSWLEFDAAQGKVRWMGTPSPAGALPFIEGMDDLSRPVEVQLVVRGTIVDVAINGRHTLVHRMPGTVGREITVFTRSGCLRVTHLAIQSIEGGN